MEINITILIQAFHFLIAYLLLRYFLFVPVWRVVTQEQTKQDTLVQAIEDRKNQIALGESKKYERWLSYQSYFARQTPDLEYAVFPIVRHVVYEPPIKKIPAHEKDAYKDELVKQLVSRIAHVE